MPAFQLTEKSFRRYEGQIKSIVDSFPNPTAFNPAPLSPNTYAARIRDAIKSLETYKWETVVDVAKLSTIRNDFSIKINKAGNVVASAKNNLDPVGKPVSTSNSSQSSSTCRTHHQVSSAELQAFILLLSNQRIDPIKVCGLSLKDINLACVGYDIEFIEEADGIILL